MDKSQEAGEDKAKLSGRALVRERLLAPLEGLPRRRGVSAEAHAGDMEKLVDKLSYMTPGALDGLAELVLRISEGKQWPQVGLIRAFAMTLETPPPRSSDYAQSLLRSAMGGAAMDGGYAVELLRHARRFGPPPQAYVLGRLKDEARDNRRKREGIRQVQEAGRVSPADQAWLEAWWADFALCQALQGAPELGEAEAGQGEAA